MTTRRLIEEELPLKIINAESAREKNINHGHIASMHRWWARRPLAMSRAVVFGSLLPDPADETRRKDVLGCLASATSFESASTLSCIGPLRDLLAQAYSDSPPKVLDCFAGGGAIPLEALRLGCDVTAVDLNPVAHIVELAALVYPQLFGQAGEWGDNPLAEDVVRWGKWVRKRAEPRLARVFPTDGQGRRPAIYFWARTMKCNNPKCGAQMPLLSSYWLANSARRTVWVEPRCDPGQIRLDVRSGPPPDDWDPSVGTVKAGSVTCPACGTSTKAKDVRDAGKRVGFGRMLYAVLAVANGRREYRSPRSDEVKGAEMLASELLDSLAECPDGTSALPDEDASGTSARIHRGFAYGFTTPRSYFNDRQLFVLGVLCEEVRAAYEAMVDGGMNSERAVAVTTYLGLVVDKVAEHNSAFTSYATNRESSRGTFPRQRMSMVWDYIETDPFHGAEGIWDGHIRWVELAIRHCSAAASTPATVQRGDAQHLAFPDASFDAVVIDPPYYDAIQYADLSDFFYVWLKRSIGHLHPTVFGAPLAPKAQEVIENPLKKGTDEFRSESDFEHALERALREIRRVVRPDGVVAIVFAHTDVTAWERLLSGLRLAGLVVSTSWPMRSERETRSTAQVGAVLDSSVVLVCRPRQAVEAGYYDDVVRTLESRINERLDAFDEMGIVGADYFVSAIGPAFEVFAQFSEVTRLSGEVVDVSDLMVLARQVVARRAMRRLLGDESVTDLDPISLLYLTWRWAYDNQQIPVDEAYKLERALDVDLSSLEGPSGLAVHTSTGFSLRAPDERRGLRLGTAPLVVDVLHVACLLWDEGRRKELETVLADTGMSTESAFWSLARALVEVLPDGDRERTMLLGLTGNQEAISSAAAEAARPRPEQQTLL